MLPKRERFILFASIIGLAVLILTLVIIEPLWAARTDLGDQIAKRTDEARTAKSLNDRLPGLRDRWNSLKSGVLPRQADDAEAQLLRNVEEWARLSGLNVTSLKTDRADQGKSYRKVIVHTTATGSMVNVSRFLYRIKIAPGLVRVAEMSVDTRKDGVDDVTMTAAVSTLCQVEETKDASAWTNTPAKPEESR